MRALTFRGGVHPEYYKEISVAEPLREAPLPDIAVLPLLQHIGAPDRPVVKKGDYVEEGQVIGASDSFLSSPVHSPVYGKVLDIKKAFHPSCGPVLSVFIERDKEKPARTYPERERENLSPQEIIGRIKNAGIVGMGGAAFPTHVKLSVPEGKKVDILIINGAECEPYLTCDHTLMTRKTGGILKGMELIIDVLAPKETVVAIEDNKKSAIFALEKLIKKIKPARTPPIRVVTMKTKYPQGGEKQLIKAITGREVPPGGLPFDVGALVQNVGTVYAVYEAVCLDKPLIERVVTVSGDCMHRPGNYLVRIGSSIKDIVERCSIDLYKEPEKVVAGGPMTGFTQPDMDTPILKGTSGVLFLSSARAKVFEERQCIRCARCVDVCPVNLIPTEIMKNAQKQRREEIRRLYPEDCIECGACAYICPARIPLVQYIKQAKTFLPKGK